MFTRSLGDLRAPLSLGSLDSRCGLRAWLRRGAQTPPSTGSVLPRPRRGSQRRVCRGSAGSKPKAAGAQLTFTEPYGLTTQFPCLLVTATPSALATFAGTVRAEPRPREQANRNTESLGHRASPRRGVRLESHLAPRRPDSRTPRGSRNICRLTSVFYPKAGLFFPPEPHFRRS